MLSRTLAAVSLALWISLTVFGARPAENGTTEQWTYYLYLPMFMAAVSLLLLMASLRSSSSGPVGCLSAVMLALLLAYLFFYTGGV